MAAGQAGAPQLAITVEEVSAVREAVTPTLRLRLAVDAGDRQISSLALNAHLRIEAPARAHDAADEPLLLELFGPRERWRETMRSLMWTSLQATVPRFEGSTPVNLYVAGTYDFDVVAAKYLNALAGGDVPLELLFGGTIFYPGGDGRLQAAPIPTTLEARALLPVTVWREAMDSAFPGGAWLRVRRDVFDQLWSYRAQRALPSWEATIEALLAEPA
jgi:hypothetical protein